MFSSGAGSFLGHGAVPLRRERKSKRMDLPESIAKKMKSCSVLGCEDWRDLTIPVTYHCFPTGEKNQERWEIWTALLRKCRSDPDWIPFRGSLVCSAHFQPSDFVRDELNKRTKLVRNAIPSIFPKFIVDLENNDEVAEEENSDMANQLDHSKSLEDAYDQQQNEDDYAELIDDIEEGEEYLYNRHGAEGEHGEIYEEELQRNEASCEGDDLMGNPYSDESFSENRNTDEDPSLSNDTSNEPTQYGNNGNSDNTAAETERSSFRRLFQNEPDAGNGTTKSVKRRQNDDDYEDIHAECHQRIEELETEMECMKAAYEQRIAQLQNKIKTQGTVLIRLQRKSMKLSAAAARNHMIG